MDAEIKALLLEAADAIEEGAECLRQAHTVGGTWFITDLLDERAKAAYYRETDIANRLRQKAS